MLYAAVAVLAVVVVLLAEQSSSSSWLYVNVVERGVRGIMSARVFAGCLVIGACVFLLCTSMRGVRIRGDGVEYRDIVSLGVPRLKRFKWAQIDRVILDSPSAIALDLWDGTRAFLPAVSDRPTLSAISLGASSFCAVAGIASKKAVRNIESVNFTSSSSLLIPSPDMLELRT